MRLWVDADACPAVVREMLFRAAERTGFALTLVANQPLRVPPLAHIRALQVPAGPDAADHEIVRRLAPGDLVITADLPLAAEVLAGGGQVLTPRGERLTPDNIGARLNMRDFLETLRGSGMQSGGPAAFSQADRQRFANQLDRLLTRAQQGRPGV